MRKDHTLVQWTLPKWAADLIFETAKLDSESIRLEPQMRKQLAAALDAVTEIDLPQPGKSE
jgi:hypothetical protein